MVIKEWLDSLKDDELCFVIEAKYGFDEPIWEECTKEEYEKYYGKENDISWENITKWLSSPNTYKRVPHWNNEQAGILWHMEYHEPDYYTYHKMIGKRHILGLGTDVLNYLNNRKPKWFIKYMD